MSEIIKDRLWLGAISSANSRFCRTHNISLVINLSGLQSDLKGVKEIKVDIADQSYENTRMLKLLPDLVKIMQNSLKKGTNILVVCRMGMQRSATVVAALLIKQGMRLEQAISYIRARRFIAFLPYAIFKQALCNYQTTVTGVKC